MLSRWSRDLSQEIASTKVAKEIRKAAKAVRQTAAFEREISTENEEEDSNAIIE
jgi:hypothetical protein